MFLPKYEIVPSLCQFPFIKNSQFLSMSNPIKVNNFHFSEGVGEKKIIKIVDIFSFQFEKYFSFFPDSSHPIQFFV